MANAGKKLVRSKSGLRMVSREEKDNSPFLLSEPPWIPDQQCTTCMKCNHKFDLVTRRHHCRRCGNCYCGGCCTFKVPLPRMGFVDPVRLCESCTNITKKENEFYNKHLKLLISGSNMRILHQDSENQKDNLAYCKLTPNHRDLIFCTEKPDKANTQPTEWVHDPMGLLSIQDLHIETNPQDKGGQGSNTPRAVTIKYKYIDEMKEVTLAVPDDANQRQSMVWIVALQRAIRLLSAANGAAS